MNRKIVIPPMAYVSNPAIVIAASNAGVLAFLSAGYSENPNQIRSEILSLGSARIWGIGFITWHLANHPTILDEVLKHKPPFLWFSFGNPTSFIEKSREKCPDTKVFVQVQSVAEAKSIAFNIHPEFLVIQGREAGGHGVGETGSLLTILPEILESLHAIDANVKVFAAGGISTHSQLNAALALGADGVVVGTRFAASIESALHPLAKARIVKAGGTTTIRTRIYNMLRNQNWPQYYDFRILKNRATAEYESDEKYVVERYMTASSKFEKEDEDFDFIAIAAGEGVGLIHEILAVKEIIERLIG